jgi:hypothetical protein
VERSKPGDGGRFPMRRVLVILGSVFLGLIIIIGGIFAYIAITSGALDRESKAYVDAAIPAIVTNWDENALKQRLSPEFRRVTSDNDLDRLFLFFRKLGKLKHLDNSKGDANIFVGPNGKVITAIYHANADFAAGPAIINIGLVKHEEQWQISGFRINSKAFLEQK